MTRSYYAQRIDDLGGRVREPSAHGTLPERFHTPPIRSSRGRSSVVVVRADSVIGVSTHCACCSYRFPSVAGLLRRPTLHSLRGVTHLVLMAMSFYQG